jgi:integrase/recombinase XerD
MNSGKNWTATLIRRRGVHYIAVSIPRDPILIERIKQFEGYRWDAKEQVWLLPDQPWNRERFGIAKEELLSTWHVEGIKKFERHLRTLRYSENTLKSYSDALKVFLKFHNAKKVQDFTEEDIETFHTDYILKNNLSISWQNQAINAIKHYFKINADVKFNPDLISRPRREHKLPNVLSKEEVKALIDSLYNLKHKLMISIIYACGLRRSELVNLRLTDMDSKRGLLIIKQSKGKKDRLVPMPESLFAISRDYYKQYRPVQWLFEGQTPGEPYDERSLASVFKKALKLSKITKPASLHWLRHSYATHLMESGTDLRIIQELLGHNSSRTTEIYTHVSTRNIQQIRSPFDDL